MAGNIETCVERIPEDVTIEAIVDLHGRIRAGAGENPNEAAAQVAFLWQPGQEIRVRFLDGTPAMRRRVEEIAHTWEQFANIHFVFGDFPQSELRISFASSPGGYWSFLGTYALRFGQDENTMSLTNGWDDAYIEASAKGVRRTVLHEFGHALGLIHEHQSPSATIPWDREKVYDYYWRTQRWDRAEVDHQVLQRRTGTEFVATAHDSKSIMQYPVPKELTTNGYEVPWNDELSDVDKRAIAALYRRR